MAFEAADNLQRLQYEDRHLERGYRDTQRRLNVAVMGIVFSVAIGLL